MTINNKIQWWCEYRTARDDIRGYIIDQPLVNISQVDPKGLRMLFGPAGMALIQQNLDKTLFELMDILEHCQDKRLWNILNSIWIDAPSEAVMNKKPSWDTFLMLVETRWVLDLPPHHTAICDEMNIPGCD